MEFNKHPINLSWSAEGKINLWQQMIRIRRFEQAAIKQYHRGNMGGFMVLSTGQESVAAGVRSLMATEDHSISGWRGMGHAIVAGIEMAPCMAELFGKSNGCSKGKSGAFSFYAPMKHHRGCHATAAAQTPLAAGLAFALKLREIKGVASVSSATAR